MKVGIACDHGGLRLKAALSDTLRELGADFEDFGTFTEDSVDYPDYAQTVAEQVAAGELDFGVLVCGTGLGMCIAANKVQGVRAVTVSDVFSAEMARRHNDAKVVTFGERVIGESLAKELLKVFLQTPFEGGGRHGRRLDKVTALDERRNQAERS